MRKNLHAPSCTRGHIRTCIRTYTCARSPRRRRRSLRRRCDPPACRALEGLGCLCSPACRALSGVLAGLPRSTRLATLRHPCIACSKSNALVHMYIDVLLGLCVLPDHFLASLCVLQDFHVRTYVRTYVHAWPCSHGRKISGMLT